VPRPTPAPPPIPRGRSIPPAEVVEDEPEVSGWPYPERGDRRDPEEVLTELLRAAMRGGSPITASIPSIGRNVAAGMGCVSRVVFFLMMLAAAFFFGLLGFSPPTGFP